MPGILALESIDTDDTHLHGSTFTESIDVHTFDSVHQWLKLNPKDPRIVAAQALVAADNDTFASSIKTFAKWLTKYKTGTTKVDGRYIIKTTLKLPGREKDTNGHVRRAAYKDSRSLSQLWGPLRGVLANDHYVDIDLSRAHPKLLAAACRRANIEVPTLQAYVTNYAEYESDLARDTGCSADGAKRLATRLLNCGQFRAWCREYGVPDTTKPPSWVTSLEDDLATVWKATPVCDAMNRRYKGLKKAKRVTTLQKVGMNMLLENLERHAIEYALGKCTDDERRRIIYCFDGLMVPRSIAETKNVDWFNALCTDDSPLHGMTWSAKPFKQDLMSIVPPKDEGLPPDANGLRLHPSLPLDRFDLNACVKYCGSYEERRLYTEQFFCQINDSDQVRTSECRTDTDGVYRRIMDTVNRDKFLQLPKITKLALDESYDDASGIARKGFFKKWYAEDIHAQVYDNTQWIPYNGVYSTERHSENGVRSSYNTFPGYSPHIVSGEITDLDRTNFATWKDIATEATGGPEAFDIMMQLISHKVIDPKQDIDFAIIWRSRQGEGKDTTITILEQVLGKNAEMFLRMSGAGSLGTLGGTAQLVKKLFIQVNECDKAQTKGLEGILKSAVTDPYMQTRALYKDFERNRMYALWIICSNKLQVIAVDTDSGERRFFVFEGTGKYAACSDQKKPRHAWAALHKGSGSPGLIRLMYEYLACIYDPAYDFQAAKARNAQCDPYKRMMGAARKDELFWLQDYLQTNAFVGDLAKASIHFKKYDPELDNPDSFTVGGEDAKFGAHSAWKQKVRVPITVLHKTFQEWSEGASCQRSSKRNIRSFHENIVDTLELTIKVIPSKGSNTIVEFVPLQVYYQLWSQYMITPKPDVIGQLHEFRRSLQPGYVPPVKEPNGWASDSSDSE